MDDLKIVFLEDKRPASVLACELVTGHQPLVWLVVCDSRELLTVEAVTETGDSPYDRHVFPFVTRIIAHRLIVVAASIGDCILVFIVGALT